MQAIASAKQLQVARFQMQRSYPFRSSIKNLCDFAKILTTLADTSGVVEFAAFLRILNCKCDGEIIGVEMPWKSWTFASHIHNYVR